MSRDTEPPQLGLLDLPPDVAEAYEAFKLSILRHKQDGWTKISADDMAWALWTLIVDANRPAEKGA